MSAPLVRSLDRELRIEVSWDVDPAAEEYVLERVEDALVGAFSVVYRGTGTSYADTDCRNQCRYLYRLSKSRGSRLFGPSAAVLGVACDTCKDELEPNDSGPQATALGDFQLRANLFYYRATPALYPGQQLQDDDWYWLQVPPQRVANLLITQVGLPPGSEHTYVYFYRKATTPVHVVNNQLVARGQPLPRTPADCLQAVPGAGGFHPRALPRGRHPGRLHAGAAQRGEPVDEARRLPSRLQPPPRRGWGSSCSANARSPLKGKRKTGFPERTSSSAATFSCSRRTHRGISSSSPTIRTCGGPTAAPCGRSPEGSRNPSRPESWSCRKSAGTCRPVSG